MANTFVRGMGGKVVAGAVTYAVLDWNFTKTNTLVDITNSGSKGYSEYFPTKTDGAGSFNAIWSLDEIPDLAQAENSSVPGDVLFGPDKEGTLEPGAKVVLKLYIGDSGKFYSMNARIESLAVTNNAVGDVVKFACNFKSTGVITDPV